MSLPLSIGIGIGLGLGVLAVDYFPTYASALNDTFFEGSKNPPLPPIHEGLRRGMDHVNLGDSVMYELHNCCGWNGVAEAQGIAVQSDDQIAVQTLRSIIDGTPGVIPLVPRYRYSKSGVYPTLFKDFKQSIEKACGGKVELGIEMPQMYRLTGDHQTFEECSDALFDDIGEFADPQITVYMGESHL